MKRGISEKVVYAHNPLPKASREDLLALADLPLLETGDDIEFTVKFQYGTGLDREDVVLEPGCFFQLRETEAGAVAHALADVGVVMMTEAQRNDPKEVARLQKIGLRRALTFWRERGQVKIDAYRRRHSIDRNEMDEHRYTIWPYYVADVKRRMIEELLMPPKATSRAA